MRICPGNVLDCNGTTGSKCRFDTTVPVGSPLVADFTWSTYCVPNETIQTVQFRDTTFGGDYPNVSYLWNFGAGATPATANTVGPHTVTYSSSGTKTVTLTVTNQDASFDTKTYSVDVGTCCVFDVSCPSSAWDSALSCEQSIPAPASNQTQLEALGFTINSVCGKLGISAQDTRLDDNCVNNYEIVRTYTIYDDLDSNNILGASEPFETCIQIFTISDTTKPVFNEALPGNLTVNCNAVPAAVTLTATDNCGPAPVEYKEQRTNGSCGNNYILVRTWTATDLCQNNRVHVQTILVQDTTRPVFVQALPANITVNCDAVPTAATITATDNCGTATVTFTEQRVDGNCPNRYTLTRRWVAVDSCNNQRTHIQTITVQDTTRPQFVGQLPASITVNCEAVPSAPVITATDNCGPARVTFTEQRVNGNCVNRYTLTRTWVARDTCNNTNTHVQTITVQDTTRPQFVGQLPASVTVNCESVPAAATLTATDNCGPARVTFTEQRTNGSCLNNYVLTRTWTASDTCNNQTVHVQTVTVQDTTKPQFVGQLPASVTVNCESVPAAATLTATDNCGAARVTFTEQRTNGSCLNNYVLTRTWTASDTCNNQTVHVQTVTVQDTTKPQFVGQLPASVTVNCESVPAAATLTATDNCGAARVTFTEQRTNGSCLNNYVLTRTWTASDTCNNQTVHVQTVTVQDTTKPQFVGQLPANVTVNCEAVPAAAVITATDNCGAARVTFTEQRTDGNCVNNYTLTRTWVARDTCNNQVTHVQVITVQDTTKPQFTGSLPQNITVDCNSIPDPAVLTATDNCGAATVTYSESTQPGGCTNNNGITRTWTARDLCGNTIIHTQLVIVQDTTKPQFVQALPQSLTVNCNAVPPAVTLTATDNCGSATVTFSEQRANGNCPNNYVLTRTWTARDVCNNQTIHVQTVTVQDTTKPQFVGQLPANVTVNCDAVPAAATLTATDNCGTIAVAFSEQRTNGNCPNNYVLTRTWIARDTCANQIIHVQTVTVQDTTKPRFVGQLPASVTVNCDAVPAAATLTATDNCGTIAVAFSEQRTNGNCPNNYVLTRTWIARDTCANQIIHVQTVTVQDTTKPRFVGQLPASVTVNCDAVPAAATLTATDNCGTIAVAFSEQRTNGNCPNNYVLTRTWIARDTCANQIVHIQTVTVQDTTKPQFVGQLPANVTVNCDAVPAAVTLTATDNCGSPRVTYTEQRINGNCANNYTLTRTWMARDTCANQVVHVQTITVQDTTKPRFEQTLPVNQTVCDVVPQAPILTATDNCGSVPVIYTETVDSVTTQGVKVFTRTWTATDICGNSVSHTQTLTAKYSERINIARTVCEGELVTLGNNSYGLTGTYTEIFTRPGLCDSIVTLALTVNPVKNTNIDAIICSGEQVVVGENVYTTSVTDEIVTLQTSLGCDSIITLNLIVLNSDTTITNRNICKGEVVEIGGLQFSISGTYYIPFQNNQCEGVVQLNLTSSEQTQSFIDRTICEGQSVTEGGQVYSEPGTYAITIPNAAGCDSVIILNLEVIPKTYATVNTVICQGQSVTIGNQLFNLTGSYNITLTNAAGCDSIVTLNLEVLGANDTTILLKTICQDDVFVLNGQSFTQAGTYYLNASTGNCTDVLKLVLSVNEKSYTTLDRFICQGEAIVVGTQTFNDAGVYTIVLQNSIGCDSIITLYLEVSRGGVLTQVDTTICFGESVRFAGQTFSTTGSYQVIYPVDRCRDTLLLNVLVNPVSAFSIDTLRLACEGPIVVGGQQFFEPGNYTVTIPNSLGCDSVITLTMRVRTCDQEITIYDSLPILTSEDICELSIPLGENEIDIHACDGDETSGTSTYGTWIINNETRCLEYTAGSYKGNDTLCIIACDLETGQCNTTNVIITVTGVPPTAIDDCVEETEQNVAVVIDVLENDLSPDHDPLYIESIVTAPQYGTVSVDPQNQSITYTPNKNFCGRDTLYYEVCDGNEGCDTAMVCLKVNCLCEYPQVITPNNDGYNDYLVFPCISRVDGARLLVWHRWGLIVYEDNNYKNDWDGKLKGELLPAGTYWYSIEYKDPETNEDIKVVNYFMIIN